MTDIPVPETARILSEALPFLQRYDDQVIVVKYGGHAMVDRKLAQQFARDMVMLKVCGLNSHFDNTHKIFFLFWFYG